MENIFINAVLGHFVGDYLLQSKPMALKKSDKSLTGLSWSLFHAVIYTLTICLFTWKFTPLFVGLVFLSHWPIDRWTLASKWLHLLRGRDLMAAYESKDKYREFDIAFSSIVYTACDNTMHIVLLWLIFTFVH